MDSPRGVQVLTVMPAIWASREASLTPHLPMMLPPWSFWNTVRLLPLPKAKAMPALMFCTASTFDALGPFDEEVAIGEEWPSKWAALPYIERGLTNFARVDVCCIGGLTEAKKVSGWCEAHYIDLVPHNPLGPVCTAASVQLGAAVPNFAWLEARVSPTEKLAEWSEEVFPVQPRLEGSSYPAGRAPGLGVEVNEEYLRAQEFRAWEAPHLHRRDGSYTNW